MLESILSSVLDKYVRDVVAEWDSKAINMGVWQGDLHLTNLTLNPDILAHLGYTVRTSLLCEAHLGFYL